MKRFAIIVFICFGSVLFGQGFSLTQPDAVGGNFVAMAQDQATYPEGMGVEEGMAFGPGLEFFLKYDVSPKLFVTIGTGLNTINHNMPDFFDVARTTLIPTFEIKGAYKLMTGSQFTPFLLAGVHAFGHTTTMEGNFGGADFSSTTDRYYDGAIFVGGGADVAINERTSLQVSGDLRFVVSSDADPQPQYWVAKAGIAYQLDKKSQQGPVQEEIEYPLGDDELASLDDLFKDSGSGDGFDDLDLLFQPEEEAASSMSESYADNTYDDLFDESSSGAGSSSYDYSGSGPSTLTARINELKQKMDAGFQQISVLENQVQENERVIANLSGNAAGSYAGGDRLSGSDFQRQYDNNLQKVNAKNYRDAIAGFSQLMSGNPDHKLASNCQYWIGECYNALGDYSKAIQAFNSVMEYRSSYKFDDALIMTGLCSMKIGDNDRARQKFQELVNRYPESEYAPKAMRYLGRL
ncbi:tetratricopeptide repeat protein [bacterium]|nr:tetratricopeptide repeat protein [bacterium]